MGTTTFLLIRHGAHLLGGDRIAGRMEGVRMSPLGQEQVRGTAERVKGMDISAIYTSPIERCRETAGILSEVTGVGVQVRESLAEMDFGEWTGKRLEELREEELFRRWNAHRSGTRMPGGETMLEVQGRIVGEMMKLREEREGERVVLVSHGDVIKAAMGYVLGVPLDFLLRMEISLASVSVVAWGEYGPWVLGVNGGGESSQ